MPQLIIRQCDGGERGKACKEIIKKAFGQFFACGVKNIEDACNRKRALLLNEWRGKAQQTIMLEYGLDIPYQRGVEEIAPPFELAEPKTVELYILQRERSRLNNGLATMDIRPLSKNFDEWRLNAYLDLMMDPSGDPAPQKDLVRSIEEAMFHELLHACGDVPWKGKHDGVLRQNIIGVRCIKELLRGISSLQ